ncbi:MAG: hypothetical protein ACRC1K_03210, partial [Planctomycetia bacterium]
MPNDRRRTTNRLGRWAPDAGAAVALVLALGVYHGGVLAGGLPTGGDTVRFNLGLLAHYHDALAVGELPFWNGRWGFGFPAFAESQVGALYPFHLLFFGLLNTFDAFRATFLLHRLGGALLVYGSFRWMGLRPTGAFFAAVTVMFSGFAVVHLDHLWAVEALPWSLLQFACATRILRAKVRAAAVVLPLAVAAQLLDGHFQTAFMT